MRQESTGKPDPERARATEAAAPGQKRGFFAAAGARLKRVMKGRAEPVTTEVATPAVAAEDADSDGEVSTSVQARARELLSQDRAQGTGRSRTAAEAAALSEGEDKGRRTNPPPLPSQRTAAAANEDSGAPTADESPSTGVTAIPPKRPARAAAKRPVRDSKSEALRARLGAAKAALAEAQAKRVAGANGGAQPLAADTGSQPSAAAHAAQDKPAPEITVEEADLIELQLEAADELAELEAAAEIIELDAAEALQLDPAHPADDSAGGEAATRDHAAADRSIDAADGSNTNNAATREHAADRSLGAAERNSASEAAASDLATDRSLDAAAHAAVEVDHAKSSPAAALGESADLEAADRADRSIAGDAAAELAGGSALEEDAGDSQEADGAAEKLAGRGVRSEAGSEPIRTLTIARLLARQGYFERSLSIYDELIASDSADAALRAEAEKVRAKKRKKTED